MIDKKAYAETWELLCRRFNRPGNASEAHAYRVYLEGLGMDTEAFLAAAGALWATREFFPRPADFLLVGREAAWRIASEALRIHGGSSARPDSSGWSKLRDADELTQEAVKSLGGLDALSREWVRAPLRVRDRFFEAWELRVLEASSQVPLLEGPAPARLMP